MEINFRIENIVASANLREELDLYRIARDVSNVEYEPEQFPGAILKLREPKTSLLLFKNGKLICTGAKSESEVEAAIARTYDLIRNCIKQPKGKKAKENPSLDFDVVNIVASANLALELDLYNIARKVADVEYEPEQFPGAILKLKEPKTSLLLFKNGKLICTGAKSEAEVGRAINKAFDLIKGCVKGPVKPEPVVEKPVKAPVKKAKPVRKAKPKVAVRKRPVVKRKAVKKAAKKPKAKKTARKKKPKKVKKVAKKKAKKAAKKKPKKKIVKKKPKKKKVKKVRRTKKMRKKTKAKRTKKRTSKKAKKSKPKKRGLLARLRKRR